ncbi:hypothetical protein Tco_1297044 [Tanacetum coccineum]
MSSMGKLTFFLGLRVKQKEDGIFISQDKYVAEILKKFDFMSVKTTSTQIETHKPLVKDKEAADVDVPSYSKTSHLHAMKRIFRYLKGKPKLGLWYPKESYFDLVAYSDSDYGGANLDRKSTTRGRDTKIPQSGGPPAKVGDKAVHKELGDRMERAATTASSFKAKQDSDAQTRFMAASKKSNDPPLLRGYTLRSGKDSMKPLELIDLYNTM